MDFFFESLKFQAHLLALIFPVTLIFALKAQIARYFMRNLFLVAQFSHISYFSGKHHQA